MRRYKIALIFLVVVLAIPLALAMGKSSKSGLVVVIDAAHGGSDTGVKLSKKMYEKDVTLAVAKYVKGYMSGAKGITLYLTRSSDKKLTLPERMATAKKRGADLFISLSVNAGFGENSSGYELYFPGFKKAPSQAGGSREIVDDMIRNKYLNEGVRFSQIVLKNVEKVFPRKGRGLRDGRVPVLQDLRIPAVVVEMGFATNMKDRKKLLDTNVQKSIAKALGKSIKEYFSSSGA